MSLNFDHCGECEQDPCVCENIEDGEQEDVELLAAEDLAEMQTPVNKAKRRLDIDLMDSDEPVISITAGGKAPRHLSTNLTNFMDMVEDRDEPDLRSYFDKYDLPKSVVISMCRTYANCLAAEMRAATSYRLKHL